MSGNPTNQELAASSANISPMRGRSTLSIAAVLLLGSALAGCSAGSEEVGRIRVKPAQVAGIYQLGSERLEIKLDGTYTQDIISEAQPLHHEGRWRMVNHFLNGSEVL